MTKEEWKDLKGEWGKVYQVSNKGRIKRKAREIQTSNGKSSYTQSLPELIISQRTNKKDPHFFCDLVFTNSKGKRIRRTAYPHKEFFVSVLVS